MRDDLHFSGINTNAPKMVKIGCGKCLGGSGPLPLELLGAAFKARPPAGALHIYDSVESYSTLSPLILSEAESRTCDS